MKRRLWYSIPVFLSGMICAGLLILIIASATAGNGIWFTCEGEFTPGKQARGFDPTWAYTLRCGKG